MPTVSIIIPCYNQAQYLPDAIESCLAQTYPDIEIIVVDDGSTDTAAEVAARYPLVQYIYQDNSGPARARNTGWKRSQGAFLQFLDSDDVLLPNKIARSLSVFDTYPDTGLVYTNYEVRTADLRERYPLQPVYDSKPEGHILPQLVHRTATFFAPHCALVPRQVVEKTGGFNENLHGTEDWFLWVSLAANGAVFRYVDEVLAWYRQTPGSISKDDLKMAVQRLKAYEALASLPLPPEIDLDTLLAGRHHVLAVKLWQHNQRAQTRQHLRLAMKLQRSGRLYRRLLLLLSYVTSFDSAQEILAYASHRKP
jgi:glycosyltransferase involved in cell wall biosynthesis